MKSSGWLPLIVALLALALGVSGLLYVRSQAADLEGHARVIEAVGNVRQLTRQLSEQVLAARFGLLNQYDPLTRSGDSLARAVTELDARVAAVIGAGDAEAATLGRLRRSVELKRRDVEHFKGENSVLKNSLLYLPTAADELSAALEATPYDSSQKTLDAIQQLVEATLVYNLVGDRTTRDKQAARVAELAGRERELPRMLRPDFRLLLSHARVVGVRQPAVDAWVQRVVNQDVLSQLDQVERDYNQRFSAQHESADLYRKILYGWSLSLVLAVALSGLQLRRLYQSLERRVAERTRELGNAMQALWGEMKLARKIQEALVPAAPKLEDCEVAARMRSTEEVGGDYYDVIHAGGREWILIGDVSGHGVPAGLVMRMCQTAVRTALEHAPDLDPSALLSVVNSVLTQNIRQLGEDKYMTISAFRRDADGGIAFAGAHQDICIFRAESETVETIETQGVWLGLTPDISESLQTRRFQLAPGDVLVLYTDGITEARRDGSMFEMSGLLGVVAGAAGKTAERVLHDLFAAIDGFEICDDATIVVVRRLSAGVPLALKLAETNR